MTNLLGAARIDLDFFHNLDQIICMGGYLHPLRIGWRNLPELNFSSDPEAAYAVINASTKVTLINAHICLEAPFRISDLRNTHFWNPSMHRTVRNWLLAFSLYTGVLEFYLWDLVPAVYLLEPQLFDKNTVFLNPSLAKLANGILKITTREQGKPIVMPKHIKDKKAFMHALFTAWESIAV